MTTEIPVDKWGRPWTRAMLREREQVKKRRQRKVEARRQRKQRKKDKERARRDSLPLRMLAGLEQADNAMRELGWK